MSQLIVATLWRDLGVLNGVQFTALVGCVAVGWCWLLRNAVAATSVVVGCDLAAGRSRA